MVKRQREKQYNSAREQRDYSQNRSGASSSFSRTGASSLVQRALPFGRCALTLLPVRDPVCNRDGILFEGSAALSFAMRHGVDPASGQPLAPSQLVALNVDRGGGGDGEDGGGDPEEGPSSWRCPVLAKPLTAHTKAVAVLQRAGGVGAGAGRRRVANVYSYQAYYELNVKARSYVDLVTGEPFDPKADVIVINDPENEEWVRSHRVVENFYYATHGKELGLDRVDGRGGSGGGGGDVRHSKTAQRILDQLKKPPAAPSNSAVPPTLPSSEPGPGGSREAKARRVLASDVLGVEYSAGLAATSLTSTAVAPLMDASGGDRRLATDEEILQSQMRAMRALKKKGYVRLHTSLAAPDGSDAGNNGDALLAAITLELHCDAAPRTCINFLGLCREGRYDGTAFHRLIPGFMVQGGKAPDGQADASYWGDRDFADEFDDRLRHAGRGVVSMANAGPGTNRRQFFVTFKSCPHLDRKHTVFGRVVDEGGEGGSALDAWESVPVDKRDRPRREIRIVRAEVLVDPAAEAQQLEAARFERLAAARDAKQQKAASGSSKAHGTALLPARSDPAVAAAAASVPAVGRYLRDRLRPSVNDDGAPPPFAGIKSSPVSAGEEVAPSVPKGAAAPAQPKNRPPPPSRASFGDFSGW
jgi:peptidyl-prolyl cis-trans isomerase-like protein 2